MPVLMVLTIRHLKNDDWSDQAMNGSLQQAETAG